MTLLEYDYEIGNEDKNILNLPVYDLKNYIEMKKLFSNDVKFTIEPFEKPGIYTPNYKIHVDPTSGEFSYPYCNDVYKRWNEVYTLGLPILEANVTVLEIEYDNDLSSADYGKPKSYTQSGTYSARYKSNGERSGRADIDGVETILSKLIVGRFEDQYFTNNEETNLIYLTGFTQVDYPAIVNTFNNLMAFKVRPF